MINSTLRIQLSKQFTFQDALSSLPYIQSLGIDTIYCSPIFQAISDHGYDITNPNQIAPYLSNFNHFCEEVHRHGMLIILDIVPNHMGFVDGNNPWFEETIKKGQASPYAHFFDIQWKDGKIHLPILGDEKVVEKGHALYCHWKQPPNYRRFFNIQQLIAICIEKPDVLEAHHKLIFELMQSGKIDGLRIDHPDGLLLPAAYFSALRKKRRLYTVVEKILEGDEQLPNWEVDGTVGYEYLNSLNGLFVKEESEAAFTKLYAKLAGSKDFHQVALESKREFAKNYMIAEINQFDGIQQQLIEVIAHFPIYRTYAIDTPSQRDEQIIKEAISKAVKSRPDLNFDSFYDKLLPKILQFQQLTAPIMAKGVEDTAFYRYNRLLSLNEVGGNPAQFGTSKEQFQKKMLLKAQKWPLGLITTSTHDTKRSEDARMRLNLLTEFTKEWEELVCTWIDNSIDPNTAYMIYQTLVAAWPHEGPQWPHFFERIWATILKSIREAKQHTDWLNPNSEYEARVHHYLHTILTPGSDFLANFIPFIEKIEPYVQKSSLSQLAIKIALPGVVDTYQGCETWNFQLVDPDNRSPFQLHESSQKSRFLQKLLHMRLKHPKLFLEGEYIPVESSNNVIAFIRRTEEEELLVIAGRFFASTPEFGKLTYSGQLIDCFAKKEIEAKGEIDVEEVLGDQPALYLYGKSQKQRVRAAAGRQNAR